MLAKAPNRKRAEQYLAASGAVPITIIETKKEGTHLSAISTASKITGTVAARWWTAAPDAARIASRAPYWRPRLRTYLSAPLPWPALRPPHGRP